MSCTKAEESQSDFLTVRRAHIERKYCPKIWRDRKMCGKITIRPFSGCESTGDISYTDNLTTVVATARRVRALLHPKF